VSHLHYKPLCAFGLIKYRQLTPSTKRILKVWLPSAAWLVVIAIESTNVGSSEHTGWLLYPIFHFLFNVSTTRFAMWHAVLRKTGHFVGYFTLSVLLFRSWRATFPRLSTQWCMQWATVALLSTSLVAMLDEWHQTFLPSRTGTVHDVILDSAAALVAQIALFVVLRTSRPRTDRGLPVGIA
jgi:VanZ family protein